MSASHWQPSKRRHASRKEWGSAWKQETEWKAMKQSLEEKKECRCWFHVAVTAKS